MLENADDEVTGMGFSLGPKPVRGTSVMYSKGRSAREIFHREKDGMLCIFPAFFWRPPCVRHLVPWTPMSDYYLSCFLVWHLSVLCTCVFFGSVAGLLVCAGLCVNRCLLLFAFVGYYGFCY